MSKSYRFENNLSINDMFQSHATKYKKTAKVYLQSSKTASMGVKIKLTKSANWAQEAIGFSGSSEYEKANLNLDNGMQFRF